MELLADQALNALKNDGVILHPTDTIPGIAVAFDNTQGLEKIFKLKKRDPSQSLAVLIGDYDQIKQLAKEVPQKAQKLMTKYWPGGLTIVLPARPGLLKHIVSADGVAVRMPDHAALREVIRKLGKPIAATSINVHGEPPITNLSKIPDRFLKGVDYIWKCGLASKNIPSTVIKFDNHGNVVTLREGAISLTTFPRDPLAGR